jgi:hypothetical protein
MAERNQKIYERVVQELEKNPGLGSRELYGIALNADKSIGRDTLQQFHARYFLPALREHRLAGGAAKPARRPRRQRKQSAAAEQPKAEPSETTPKRRFRRLRGEPASNRDQIRALLLQFAQELTDAESRSSLVQALARVDSYVDRIATASGS